MSYDPTKTNPIDEFNRFCDFIYLVQLCQNPNKDLFIPLSKDTVKVQNILMPNGQFSDKEYSWREDSFMLLYEDYPSLCFQTGMYYTKFEFLQAYRFKGVWEDALRFVRFTFFQEENPFIRVGTDYYKELIKKNRFGVNIRQLKSWKKDTLKDDFGAAFIKRIPQYDDFTIVPDNIDYKMVVNGCYNLYSEFPHKAEECKTEERFPNIRKLMLHIFNEQIALGYKFMKIMFENPCQILPVLVLVSKERQTGKTTFLNFLSMLFGDNFVQISPDDLMNSFNHLYATKNVIGIDETIIEKQNTIERLKALSTQKQMNVNMKHVSQYTIPFYGKIVIATNKETDFMRVDSQEIRFWVRKVPKLEIVNNNIEKDMLQEIPFFLGYLNSLPAIDMTKSRMVFTQEEIQTNELNAVKQESASGLKKELIEYFTEFFLMDDNIHREFVYVTPTDIKNRWFHNQSQISVHYISKVLIQEFEFVKQEKTKRYHPFCDDTHKYGEEKAGFVFIIPKKHFLIDTNTNKTQSEELF